MYLWVYKHYLDLRFPFAFKLHDFLYTPYGKLINVTREEADSALRELIEVTSIVDAAIVYNAVRLGGAAFFGVSQTGYIPPPIPRTGPNMGEAAKTFSGDSRMAIKTVILFQEVTTPGADADRVGYVGRAHIAGWSEMVYWYRDDDVGNLIAELKTGTSPGIGLLPARAGLLSPNQTIVGVRLYKGGAGRGQLVSAQYPGNWGGTKDIPQLALSIRGGSVNYGVSRLATLRGIPDDQVSNGEFSPSLQFANRLGNYFRSLSQWGFRALKPTIVRYKIATISSAGLVTLDLPNVFATENKVRVLGAMDAYGRKRSFDGFVSSVGPLPNQFSLASWTLGERTKGVVFIPDYDTFPLDRVLSVANRITTRRVGRPFEQYRGRRSRRQR